MAEPFLIIPEPDLEFRYAQRLLDPRSGLGLFGPYDTDASPHPRSVRYAVIGPPEGLEAFDKWSALIAGPVMPEEEYSDSPLWPPFPGFDAAFNADWPLRAAGKQSLDRKRLLRAARDADPAMRAHKVVNAYLDGIKTLKKRDETFDIVVCVVPDEVWSHCRPESVVRGAIGRRPSRTEREQRRRQVDMFGGYEPEAYELSPDFRRQLKARAMEFELPLQLIRESTLWLGPGPSPERRDLTPLPDRAWNLSTTVFYKAGGKPWRLATAREGVCYIGIAFRRSSSETGGGTACCAAQMFLDTGDGIVFRGEFGPWYSPQRRECHLSSEAARELLTGVLETYHQLDGRRLSEVFLHSRSTIDDEEFKGYRDACPSGVKVVAVRVRQDHGGLKLFRAGNYPVMRGTLWKVNDRQAFLWASGFKPTLRSYDGWEVPTPLSIEVQHGTADIGQVAADILGLTKLNYNACRLGDAEPVTVRFSDAVGEILVTNPTVAKRCPQFKYYI